MSKHIIPVISFVALLLTSCHEQAGYSSFAGLAQGTTYSVVFRNTGKIKLTDLRAEVEQILQDFDMSLSLYKDSSILSRINRNEEVTADKYFISVFNKSRYISELTGGAFDITVGPLVKAWGFGPDERRNVSPEKIDSLLQLIGMDKVKLENGKVYKSDPGVTLDFNAIAQGYSVDVVSDLFDSKGIKSYLVDIGGEVRVKGEKGDKMWRIGIDKPVDGNMMSGDNLQAVIEVRDVSLATSGNYRKFYIEDGIKYSHTIDPKTGYPARNRLLSATILASDCATADGIATACMVMGKEKSIEFLDLHPEYEGYLVYSDDQGNFRTWMTDKLKEYISDEN